MGDQTILLKVSGLDVFNGQVPVEAFSSAIRKFAATIAFFERIYTSRTKRSSDLNIAMLTRENPFVVGLNPVSRFKGYSPTPAYGWAFDQMVKLSDGGDSDVRIPVELLDNLYDLSDEDSRRGVAKITAQFESKVIDFNGNLARSVRRKRTVLVESMPPPEWYTGVSKGIVFGELRGVTDIEGEREFFVCPPRGANRVKCVFTEEMRDQMNRFLFKLVRIQGFLFYEGSTPHPSFVQASAISLMDEDRVPHMGDLEGLFSNSYYPLEGGWPQ